MWEMLKRPGGAGSTSTSRVRLAFGSLGTASLAAGSYTINEVDSLGGNAVTAGAGGGIFIHAPTGLLDVQGGAGASGTTFSD